MRRNQKGMAVLESLLILIIIAIIGATGLFIYRARQNSNKTLDNAAATNQTAETQTGISDSTPLATGTDNSSLQADLNNINSNQTQAASDSNSANSAVNDQQNEISVPTN